MQKENLFTTEPIEDIEEVEQLDQSSIDELVEVLQFEKSIDVDNQYESNM